MILYSPNGTDRRFLKHRRRRDVVEAATRSRSPEDAGASVGDGGAVWALVANGGADETARDGVDAALFEMAMAIEHAGTERACIVTGSVDGLARAALWVAVGGEVVAIPAAWAMPSHLLVEAVCALFFDDANR